LYEKGLSPFRKGNEIKVDNFSFVIVQEIFLGHAQSWQTTFYKAVYN
jgi:hypothetical protein